MAWLQKRPQVSDAVQFYSFGLNKTKLIIGLGNPGKKYDGTRHNIGFECLDTFVSQHDEMSEWINKSDLKVMLSSGQLGDTRVIAIKPSTYMNLSGTAVDAVLHFYKLNQQNMLVVHDELELDFGQIRTRNEGTSAGHNGLKSIIEVCGESFDRVRIGIGPKKPARIDSADFVLQKFSDTEQGQLSNLTKEVSAIISEFIYGETLLAETRSFLV